MAEPNDSMGDATGHLGFSQGATFFADDGVSVVSEAWAAEPAGADSRAVARAYRRSGPSFMQDLRGRRYCFLLHDRKAGMLLAASSITPPWPLAYWSSSRMTVVSSRLLPMLRCPEVPRDLDESYLAHLVMGLSAMPDGSTVLRGVRRLRPGELLLVDADGAHVSRVDRLEPRRVAGDRVGLARLFVEELGEAVGAAAVPGPAAVSLSGGLDSAALVAALRLATGEHALPALCFVAPELDAVAEIGGLDAMQRAWPELRLTRVDASRGVELLALDGELRDDPPLTPLAHLHARRLLWARARDAGVRAVIEGEGGDELFAILPTPLDALRRGRLLRVARQVLAWSSGRRALLEYGVWLPFLPRAARRMWLARQPLEPHLPAFAAPDAMEHPIVREATREYLATLVHGPFSDRLNEWLAAPMVVGAALSRRHVAAGFGLELAWPMLERGVLELVLGLHAAGAIDAGPQKAFLQGAFAGIVPDEVRLPAKDVGLYRAFIVRVLTSRRAREVIRDARVQARLARLVQFEVLEEMLDVLAAGKPLSPAALWQLECVVAFAEWYARASREYGVD
jgi:asparagine synthase (glutamine-hydrolysing)